MGAGPRVHISMHKISHNQMGKKPNTIFLRFSVILKLFKAGRVWSIKLLSSNGVLDMTDFHKIISSHDTEQLRDGFYC